MAHSWGGANLQRGDVILLTEMEHHSNLVPWQMLAAEQDLRLEFIPVTPEGRARPGGLACAAGAAAALVALTQMSNVLGTINPVAEIAARARQAGAVVVIDAAQSVPHLPVDVQALEVDFLAFSAHKMCGPTGIGVLYARPPLLEAMPPFLGGGDMIKRVELRSFVPNDVPHKFEAGTPAIAEAIGLHAGDRLPRSCRARSHSRARAGAWPPTPSNAWKKCPELRVYGPPAEERGGVVSFTLEGIHPHDVAQLLDADGIAVRAGHHCAMPLHQKFGIPASTRASFYLYNTPAEIDRLVEGLYRVKTRFG